MSNFEVNWTPYIIGIVAFAIGYLFAMLDRRVTTSMKEKRKPEVQVVEKIIHEESALSIVLTDEQQPKVRLGGELVDAQSITPDQRKYLIGLLTRIRPLLDGKPATESQARTPLQRPVAAPRPTTMAYQASPSALPAHPPTQPKAALDPDVDAPVGTSMVAQINAILKENIANTPLKNKGVFLLELPGGGAAVYIGTTRYDGVGDVPDPEVKAAIQVAIAEWEEKYTPGD